MALNIDKKNVKSVVVKFEDGMEMLATGPFKSSWVRQRSEREENKPTRIVWEIFFTEGPGGSV